MLCSPHSRLAPPQQRRPSAGICDRTLRHQRRSIPASLAPLPSPVLTTISPVVLRHLQYKPALSCSRTPVLMLPISYAIYVSKLPYRATYLLRNLRY
eukprot:979077-Rhodomonas_salina.2